LVIAYMIDIAALVSLLSSSCLCSNEGRPVGVGGRVVIDRESTGAGLQAGTAILCSGLGNVEDLFARTVIGRNLQFRRRSHHGAYTQNGEDQHEKEADHEHSAPLILITGSFNK
jgi:hypothetical protein